jgi:Fur family iron response transcriptional regulator
MDLTRSVSIQQKLRDAGILPTLQRVAVGTVLFSAPVHMTAEQVLRAAREHLPGLSRATVYAVLQLFVRQRLLKALPIEGSATVYDSTVTPHHHVYNVDTGEVADLTGPAIQVLGLPELGDGLELSEVDVIVRVRTRRPAPALNA